MIVPLAIILAAIAPAAPTRSHCCATPLRAAPPLNVAKLTAIAPGACRLY